MRAVPAATALLALTLAASPASGLSLEFRGVAELPPELTVDGLRVGGLSGAAYDPDTDVYYAISDDHENARFHTLRIDLGDGRLDPGDVTALSAVRLRDLDGTPFGPGEVDAEGIARLSDGTLMIGTEPTRNGLPAEIRGVDAGGRHLSDLPTDRNRYDPRLRPRRGARRSGGYESLALSADGRSLLAAFEQPLKQDVPDYDPRVPAPVRVKTYDLASRRKIAEVVYLVGPLTISPEPPGGWAVRGLNDLLPLGANRFLSLEREAAQGRTDGTRTRPVELFEAVGDGATDVRGTDALSGRERPMTKRALLHLDRLRREHGLERIGSHEALVLGPRLPDGRESLILIEDNDFARPTQILLFALTR